MWCDESNLKVMDDRYGEFGNYIWIRIRIWNGLLLHKLGTLRYLRTVKARVRIRGSEFGDASPSPRFGIGIGIGFGFGFGGMRWMGRGGYEILDTVKKIVVRIIF